VLTRHRSQIDTAALAGAVAAVADPELHRTLGELGMVREIVAGRNGQVRVVVALTTAACPLRERLQVDVTAAASVIEGVNGVAVEFTTMAEHERREVSRQVAAGRPSNGRPVAAQIYAVASGKGGVGKSSIAANLAVALSRQGKAVGLLDADVWGYSVPQLFGVRRNPIALHGMMLPIEAHGVRLMSTGFLVDDETPVVWRGPMLHKALEQFLADVVWGDLDVLLLDLPPGTGDVTLSVLELLPEAGLIAVTTPQRAARTVASRIGVMAKDARMPIAGVIENMSELVCAGCGTGSPLFGSGGGRQLADDLGAPLLAQVPLDMALREAGDAGVPVVAGSPGSVSAQAISAAASALRPVRRSLVGRPLSLTVVSPGAPLAMT
jgi:ATP-binding protein involved in chromosome partitioning